MQLAVVNQSSYRDDDIRGMVRAVDVQLQKDFTPLWGVQALISFSDCEHRPGYGKPWVVLLDNTEEAEYIGYRDLTPEGQPLSCITVEYMDAADLSVEISHKILEMLADPFINRTIQMGDSTFYAMDICDPCRGSQYAYQVDGYGDPVSDFVTPFYFMEGAEGYQFDRANHINEPFQVLPHCSVGVWSPLSGWQQLHASQMSLAGRPKVGSRRERRRTPREEWQRSEVYRYVGDRTPLGKLPEGEEMITTKG